MCRRYGALWAYDFESGRIQLHGTTSSYVRADMSPASLEIRFCPRCACVVAWRGLQLGVDGRRRLAVNVRLAAPELVAALQIDRFEGLVSFEDLPSDGRCVRDFWF